MTMVNPTDKTDGKLRETILTAQMNIEVWQATKRNFRILNKPSKTMGQISESASIQQRFIFRKPRRNENKKPHSKGKATETPHTFNSSEGKTYVQMVEGRPKMEID
jgi:hypothetical protein